ncbi:MAG: HAMP domain-containing histidine kinase [Halomonas sp.]|jgi:signal transduction histidine kinase|uniref:histidine kinase n=1 Tax=Vreelandella aquamarina TaxID=77097 RepID=A0A6F8SRF6_9GAMM|nr:MULTISPECIES: HAMP domain-containing sensor histidine kinase [Halomonas]MCC4292593.1 HAMP domain-containing histidine kinase [Halomonas axialensis]MCD1652585.1 HAMP domain-containing histidine kinase [Halomonas axialensis]MCD2088841.1 HAMP domain-containing histidine kinase [Halomonas meridiana]MCF2911728.1 HAMP domain-containing histidine kinase [Halomonas sp. Cn5-12]MCO7244151.1 HAMP domain-containing histidine kinase [Halomonas sp. Ps84H-12]|tara:strand:- start:641 stop:2005 length:1365 start_codon:yes stop_codon:yes gene_type:complete
MSADVLSWSQRWASRSINLRLLLAVLLMVLLALPVAGWLLAHHYRTAAVNAFDERLEATLNVVIAGVTYDPLNQQLNYERALGDSRFDHVYSGWYWQITDEANRSVASRSLWDQRLPVLESERVTARTLPGPRGQQLRVVERDIYLAPLETPLHVSVAARDDDLREDIQEFQQMLWLGLLGLGALLLGVLALQVRWGLAPLRRMNANLREVEQGRAEQLETRLPDELATLAKSMNAVLARDQRLIERGRHTAGNLAHALKTPISVMRLLAKQLPGESRDTWEAELSRIDSAVRHHLARASAAGEGVRFAPVALQGTLAPLITGLARLAQRRHITLRQTVDSGVRVHMDGQDLQEMVGNLLDNALRWGKSDVHIRLQAQSEMLLLVVSDDGPGMTPQECQAAVQRGRRLDEQRSGSGLGLAIVTDLVTLYHGQMRLQRAESGGLEVVIELPVVAT